MNGKAYLGLLIVSAAAGIAGILTLIPNPGASYPNLLGYRSICTFAPAASLFCFFIAGSCCVLRASFIKRKALYGRTIVRAVPVAVVAVTLVLALASTGWFISVKSGYTDAESAATAIQTE